MTTEKIPVVNGPGKWDLILALHESGRTATFQIQKPGDNSSQPVTVCLSGFERDYGAWDNSRLTGSSTDSVLTEGMYRIVYFEIDYNQVRRSGELAITKTL